MTSDYETPPLPFAGDPDRTCPYCGHEEPNDFLLTINHAPDSDLAAPAGICIAMELTRFHVMRDVQRVLDGRAEAPTAVLLGLTTETADRGLKQADAALKRSITRARECGSTPPGCQKSSRS